MNSLETISNWSEYGILGLAVFGGIYVFLNLGHRVLDILSKKSSGFPGDLSAVSARLGVLEGNGKLLDEVRMGQGWLKDIRDVALRMEQRRERYLEKVEEKAKERV